MPSRARPPTPTRPRASRAAPPQPQPPPRRAPRQIQRILRATLEELARSDYSGLSMERISALAGVNKTTLYRHWPTKADLVRGALSCIANANEPAQTSGSLRGDLIRLGRQMLQFANSFEGQCLFRLRLLDHPEPELAAIARQVAANHHAHLHALGRQAVERGELAQDSDLELILDLLSGALHMRLLLKNQRVDEVVIARLVDVILYGATPSGSQRKRHQTANTR